MLPLLPSLTPFCVYLPKVSKRQARLCVSYSIVKVQSSNIIITQKDILLASSSISMLYKRAFRKEKEVITFLIKARIRELAS